jgi:hypothetical protein
VLEIEPVEGWYFPPGHIVHTGLPGKELNVPEAHIMQVKAPGIEFRPAAQFEQALPKS